MSWSNSRTTFTFRQAQCERFFNQIKLLWLYLTAIKLSRHSSMDAGIQSQGCVRVCAILGFWIAAIPAAMTCFSLT